MLAAQQRRVGVGAPAIWGQRAAQAARRPRSLACRAAAATAASYGLFVCSGSPAIATALASTPLDWLCLDAQHGAVGYEMLAGLLAATRGATQRIVRVAGPWDRAGMQQALDLGADGVMVPLINSREEAAAAVSFCRFPPAGCRSVAYPVPAVYAKGTGPAALATYLQEANSEVQVWLQVETAACLDALDEVLSVPGITCAFLGPADMGFSLGLHVKHGFNLAQMLNSSEMEAVYAAVLQGCQRHGVAPGVFCLGAARAAALAAQGFTHVGYGTDLGALIDHAAGSMAQLRDGPGSSRAA